jgi:para-nitrobenzyl esterase
MVKTHSGFGVIAIMDCDKLGELIGSEDCLYLNIWRPRGEAGKLPVFFWIHGGGNSVGQSAMSLYHGANLAGNSQMVVVSINYRLGPLGWFTHPGLSTGDPLDDSGNYGTLDMIQALKWVRDNIEAFGGDPNNITIAGESAGGMNVYSLLASPLAAGYFHKAISESGAPMSTPKAQGEEKGQWLLAQLLIKDRLAKSEDDARTFLQDKNQKWIAEYLRSKTPAEIYSCYDKGFFGTLGKMQISSFIFRKKSGGLGGTFIDGAVLKEDIKESLDQGSYNKVPFLVGSNKEEGKLFLPLMLSFLTERELCQKAKEVDPDNITIKVSDYIKNPLYYPIYEPMARLLGKGFEMMGVDNPAKMMARHQQNIYVYRFDWDEEPKPLDFIFGAMHGMELPFVFGNFQKDQDSVLRYAWSKDNEPARLELSRIMMAYWSNLARNGDPNGPGLPEWPDYSRSNKQRIHLDTGITGRAKSGK